MTWAYYSGIGTTEYIMWLIHETLALDPDALIYDEPRYGGYLTVIEWSNGNVSQYLPGRM